MFLGWDHNQLNIWNCSTNSWFYWGINFFLKAIKLFLLFYLLLFDRCFFGWWCVNFNWSESIIASTLIILWFVVDYCNLLNRSFPCWADKASFLWSFCKQISGTSLFSCLHYVSLALVPHNPFCCCRWLNTEYQYMVGSKVSGTNWLVG